MPHDYKPEVNKRLNISPGSTNHFTLKNRPAILGAVTFTILACLTGILVYQRFLIREKNRYNETHDIVISAKDKLQDILMQSGSAAKTLSFFIQPDGSVKDFDLVSSQVLAAFPFIDALELEPGGVVRYLSPLKGNEFVLGYDILHDSLHNKEAYKTIRKKELFFAGPLVLKQGGTGVVGRLPVYRNSKFWGFSVVVIKISTLLRAAGIDSGNNGNYHFQLSKINPDTGVEEFFIPQSNAEHNKNIVSIEIPSGEWKLSAASKDKGPINIFLLGILGILSSIMGGWLVLIITKRPEKLNQLVTMRTTELVESEEKYRSLIEQASDGIIISDLTGVIMEVNRSMCTMSSYTVEEMTGRHINDFMPPEDVIHHPLHIADLLEGKTLRYERRLLRKDGTIADVEVNSKMATRKTLVGFVRNITERKKSEDAVTKSNEKLLKEKELSDSIINSLPAVFYLYNKEGEFLRWNKNFELVTGYSGDEIKQLHPLELFDEHEKTMLAEKIKSVFITGEDNVEANFISKSGKKTPYYFSGMKIDYEGEICLMGFGLDFSNKVQSDKLIKESEQKFRGLVEQASDGIAILSEKGSITYVSPSTERILGYMESEIMQLNITDLAHPDDLSTVAKVFEEVMQNPGLPIKGPTAKVLHKDGSWRSMEFIFTNMLHIPSINGIVENFRDITETLAIQKRIITEKYLSDSVINSLPGIFYLYDNTGRFIRWNKNFETVTGYEAEEISKMHPIDFFDDDTKPLVTQRLKDLLQKRMPDIEFFLLTKSKKKIPFLYNSIVIDYEGVPSIAGMAFDITERKKMDQQLLISNQQLEQKALELSISYDELERFAYIVSHDLQEPLRMISSFLKLLEQRYKTQLDETAEKYIHFAVDGSERMKQLITDLLEYSRTGTNKDIPADTDMNDIMSDVLGLFENSIHEQNAVIEINPLPVLHHTSKVQMYQLMQNLISNALKYHGEKRLIIKIDAIEKEERWIFSVQDNGISIDPKFAERIFVVFQRLHNKNEYSGTGIGLSICKKIVERHGGKIWTEPSPGGGSIFYFTIPQKRPVTVEIEN